MGVSERGSELRIALSMRGGVSLAVWIGGAVAELDRLTRTQAGAADSYARLLAMGGYRRAVLDVITGASAGGLNGVVLAASRAYGFDFSEMLPIWVRLADIELLTRDPVQSGVDPVTGKASRRPESLLRGDGYFEASLRRELATLIAAGQDDRAVTDPFDLILSATLVTPREEITDADPFAPLPEVRRSANFHFRYLGEVGDNGGDFQSHQDASADRPDSTAYVLAKAGRSTSSFPVAFEPSRVGAESARVFSDPPAPDEPPQRILDGGVLDNIPVGKAIEAIAAAPGTGEADRWLVFLHPSPSARTATAATQAALPASPAALKTLVVTASAAFGQESLLDDLSELAEYNAEAARQRRRREALLSRVATDGDDALMRRRLALATDPALEGSRIMRAQVDAARALGVIYGDIRVRRPVTQGPDRNVPSEWLRSVRREVADEIERAFLSVYDAAAGDDAPRPLLCSSGGMMLACDLVSGWVREATPRAAAAGDEQSPITVLDRGAHRVSELRRVVQVVRNWSDQAWLTAATHGPFPDARWVSDTVVLVADVSRWVPVAQLEALAEAHELPLVEAERPPGRAAQAPSTPADLRRTVCLAAVDVEMRAAVQARAPIDPAERGDLAGWVWRALVDIIVSTAPAAAPGDSVIGRLFAAAAGDASRDAASAADRAGAALRDLVVLLTPAQASSLESDEEVRFVRVTGANDTPLRRFFAPDGAFGVEQKLCGNNLANFAAFFSARWRANDWMWGRLDAVKSIVDLTTRPERVRLSGLDRHQLAGMVTSIAAEAGMQLTAAERRAIEDELDVVLRDHQGSNSDTQHTRVVLTEALQRRVFAENAPVVAALGERPKWPSPAPAPAPTEAAELDRRMREYRVGSESFTDLQSRRRTQIGMRLSMVAYAAFRPPRRGIASRAVRGVMSVLKPLYLFGSFAALNLARAMFLVNMTALGCYVGPWRYRGPWVKHHTAFEVLTWDRLPWSTGGKWWPKPIRPSSVSAWIGLTVVSLLTIGSLVLGVHTVARRRAARRSHLTPPSGLWWYFGSAAIGAAGLLVSSATGICTGPLSVLVGAGIVALLTCLWMRDWARYVVIPLGTSAVYAAVSLAFFAFSHFVSHSPWFGYTGWIAVVGLYAAQAYIATICTFTRVLYSEDALARHIDGTGAVASSGSG